MAKSPTTAMAKSPTTERATPRRAFEIKLVKVDRASVLRRADVF